MVKPISTKLRLVLSAYQPFSFDFNVSSVSGSFKHYFLVHLVRRIFSHWCSHAWISLSSICLLWKMFTELAKKLSWLELQTNQSQDAKWSSESCLMTLITSSFPYLCFFVHCVYLYVCTGCFHIWSLSCVFLWAHSHALWNLFSS